MSVCNNTLIALICEEAMSILYDDSSSSGSNISTSSSSSSSDEDDNKGRKRTKVEVKRKRTLISEESRIKNFYSTIIPTYSPSDFQKHFRVTRQTLEILHKTVGGTIRITHHTGRPPISADEKLLMTLWFLGTREAYKSVSERFNVSTSTLFSAMVETCKALHVRSSTIITWPNEARRNATKNSVYERTGFPGVIGAIGVSHIKIKFPREHANLYAKRKDFHSVILQAVCDHTMLFISCYAGECGRAHAAEVYERSPLFRQTQIEGATFFPDDTHLLGEGAYSIGPYMMTPYQDNGHLTSQQKTYNYRHSSARCVIDHAFAHLKGRWQRLAYLAMSRMDLIPIVIMGCCALHNICVSNDDVLADMQLVWEPHLDGPDGSTCSEEEQNLRMNGVMKREQISQSLSLMNH